MKDRLIDYIDFEKVNILLEGFYQSTGFVTAILDLDGNILSKSGWRQICTDFHRINKVTSERCTVSDTTLAGQLIKGEKYHCYRCLNGLIDVAVPIVIEGKHIANLFSGQFFFEAPDINFFKKQAAEFGFNSNDYIEALQKVPVISEENVKTIMDFLLNMTMLISEMTLQRIELTRLNETVSESEETYRMLYDSLTDAVFTSELNDDKTFGKFIHVNEIACKWLGYSHDELLLLTPSEIITEKSRDTLILNKDSIINHQKVVLEVECVAKDCSITPVEVNITAGVFKGKTLIHAIARDITDRKKAEKELMERGAIISSAVEYLPVIFYVIDNEGIFQLSVGAGLKSLGLKSNQVVGISVFDLYKDYPVILDAIKKAMENQPASFESVVNGAYHYNFLTPSPDIGIIGVAIDITELKQTFRKLEQSRADYIKLFEDHLAVKLLIDPETGQIIDSNNAAARYYGWTREQLRTMNVSQINSTSEAQIKAVLQKANENTGAFFEFIHKLANGSLRNVEVYATKINFDGRQVLHSIIHDVTERKKAQEELVIAKEKAEESDRLKTSFLQNMSHEIRTPMNAIMGFSELLFDIADDKERLREFTDIISMRCDDLLTIINDILDISKIESGQAPVNMEDTNLSDLFYELSAFFNEYRKRFNKQHIEFSLVALNNQADNHIYTDKTKLKQIFINLISNAFKFTDQGKIAGGCRFVENNKILFYVTDTGPGIPADKHQFIFDRFTQINYQGKENIGGTGLGLSIVKALVKMLDGEIHLESEPGKGSTFSFTIPYHKSESHVISPEVIARNDKFDFSGKKVLLVEDDKFNAIYLTKVLTDTGITISLAGSGKDAIDLAIAQDFDLILMDIRLPDMSGYDAIKIIKEKKQSTKFVAQTAFASTGEQNKALSAGCIDYLGKPIRKEALLSVLKRFL